MSEPISGAARPQLPSRQEDLLTRIGYQMRTPLSGIVGMATLLADTSLSPEQRGYVDTIRSTSETLLAMVRDLLDRRPSGLGELPQEPRRRPQGAGERGPAALEHTPSPPRARRSLSPGSDPAADAALDPGQAARGRVLLAEDNPVSQKVTVGHLRGLGYAVDVVADGREAIDAMRRGAYDMILMDCQMPNMDGFDATRLIRLIETGDKMPIIALTADVTESNHRACLAAGMDEVLLKPVSREVLGTALERWTGRAVTADGGRGRR